MTQTTSTKLAVAGVLDERPVVLFGVFFGVALLLRFWALDQPPVWDGVGGLFPAASHLAETGFDYPALLAEPGYRDGGPNVHALSGVTLVTAVVIAVVGDGAALFPVLHTIHLLLGALLALGVHRLARTALAPPAALLLAVASVIAPVVATQIGDIYLELPVATAAVWAGVWWMDGRRGATLTMLVAAVVMKESGIIVAMAVAFAAARTSPRGSRLGASWYLLVPAAVSATLRLLVATSAVTPIGYDVATIPLALASSVRFVTRVPDVAVLIVAYAVARPFLVDRPIPLHDPEPAHRLEILCAGVLLSTLVFYLLLGGFGVALIPRYLTLVLPFLLIGVVLLALRVVALPVVEVVLAGLIVLFAINGTGLLYPPVGSNSFAVAERSTEYRDLLALHLATGDVIAAVPPDTTVFYGLQEHYRMTYPIAGYVDTPVTNGVNVYRNPRYETADLARYPDRFVLVIDHRHAGGATLEAVWERAEADPAYVTTVETLVSGEFVAHVVAVTRST